MSNRKQSRSDMEITEPPRFVADLGNTRLKLGKLDPKGNVSDVIALPIEEPSHWDLLWKEWNPSPSVPSKWMISSVNPPIAVRFEEFLKRKTVCEPVWYRSASDVPIPNILLHPEATGADRAVAVFGASAIRPPGLWGHVVLCGTAITVERIRGDGTWQGGAIAPGLSMSAHALASQTAQLPLICPRMEPNSWGNMTLHAMEAGIYWGAVGGIRELLMRQSAELETDPWVIFSGGDAEALHRSVAWRGSQLIHLECSS